MSKKKSRDDLEVLEIDVIEELTAVIGDACDDGGMRLQEIQPPSNVLAAAACAAAQVLIGFERGYRMSVDAVATTKKISLREELDRR